MVGQRPETNSVPSVGCSEPGGVGLLSVGFLGFTILNSKTLCTLKLYKWECLKGQGGREERVRRKEGKGSRQRGGHPFPFSLALLRAWMIPRSRQLQQLSNSNLAHPPWFTTPHRWHRVRLRPLTNHLHCALFLEILGCATGAGKNIASHASPPPPPPTISVCGTKNGGSFSAQVQLYPKPSIPMLIITATSPVFSLVATSSHRIYS